jgi:hypothetical protein
MASPFQQQVLRRKLIYTACILGLLGVTWWLRAGPIRAQALDLAIREQDRGEVELTDAFVRLSLVGFRGLATCYLWSTAMDQQKKNEWNELELTVTSLTKLQPHFITPWLYQSWNLAYNVSVESDRPKDKFFYVTRGIHLLAEGERKNHHHPDLRWNIGFYTQHKVGRSDETNVMRSIFQLSYVPPNERDPARFWVESPTGRTVNHEEFARFCQKYPQLVRRLRTGIRRQSKREWERQFTCESPEDVVRFLEDNWRVPSMYELPERMPVGSWVTREDKFLPMEERFPVLPPRRANLPAPQVPYEEQVPAARDFLTNEDVPLNDDINCFLVAQAWYGYAQEPIPLADELPGSTKPIEDRAVQRRPKHMTTMLFRVYPAHAQRFYAERLEEEGWFLDEGWRIEGWFPNDRFTNAQGHEVPAVVGTSRQWSREAWEKTFTIWEAIGGANHLILAPAEEQNKRREAEYFLDHYGLRSVEEPLPELRVEDLPADLRDPYRAARYLFEYYFYRRLSRFPEHLGRAEVERQEQAIKAHRLFYESEQEMLQAFVEKALAKYNDKDGIEAWKKILIDNPSFRNDMLTQEYTAELQWRYLRLDNRVHGRALKERVKRAAGALPLLPPTASYPSKGDGGATYLAGQLATAGALAPAGAPLGSTAQMLVASCLAQLDAFALKGDLVVELPGPIKQGPFDVPGPDGEPLLKQRTYEQIVEQLDPSVRFHRPQQPPEGVIPPR